MVVYKISSLIPRTLCFSFENKKAPLNKNGKENRVNPETLLRNEKSKTRHGAR